MFKLRLKGRYYKMDQPNEFLGYDYEELELNTEETTFLLVDVYDKEPGFLEVTKNHIRPALEMARKVGLEIVYVNNSCPKIALQNSEFQKKIKQSLNNDMAVYFNEDSIDPKEYVFGTSGNLKIPEEIKPQDTDFFVRKHVYSGFFETRLESLLRNLGTKNLISVGYEAGCCLLTTLIDALYRNFKVILIRDCTLASEAPEEMDDILFTKATERFIRYVESLVGVTITSDEFIKACNLIIQN